MPPRKRTIEELATEPLVDAHDIADRFVALEKALPEGDGVRWFCTVHSAMSETVAHDVAQSAFEDPALLERVDIHLVALFFAAVAADATKGVGAVRRSWQPLFARRADDDVQPVRFALAGINAHISTDLPLAVVQTCKEAQCEPDRGSALYRDYCRINDLETKLRASVQKKVYGPLLNAADRGLGTVDDRLETFGFWAAREAAWVTAEIHEALPGPLAKLQASALDRTTGYMNKVLLFG